jgi:hypothetical protein
MWKKEEDLDLPIKGSPTAALCFAIIAGSVQHNAIGTSLIGGFTLKLHNSRELYQEIAGKNSDKVFFDITNRRPMSKKTTDTTNDRTGWSQIAWRGSMSKKTTDNTNDSLRLIRELAKEMVEYQKIFVTKEYLTDIINETKINVYPTGKALLAIRVAGLSVNLFYAGMAWSDKKTAMVLTIFIGDYLQENSILLRKDFMDQFAFYLERLKSAKDQDRGLWDVASETYALLDQEQGIEYEDKTALLNFVKAVTYIFKLGLRNNHEMIDDVGLKCGIMAKKTAESMPEDRSSAEEL